MRTTRACSCSPSCTASGASCVCDQSFKEAPMKLDSCTFQCRIVRKLTTTRNTIPPLQPRVLRELCHLQDHSRMQLQLHRARRAARFTLAHTDSVRRRAQLHLTRPALHQAGARDEAVREAGAVPAAGRHRGALQLQLQRVRALPQAPLRQERLGAPPPSAQGCTTHHALSPSVGRLLRFGDAERVLDLAFPPCCCVSDPHTSSGLRLTLRLTCSGC